MKVSDAKTCHSVDKGDASYASERTVMVTVLSVIVSTLGTVTSIYGGSGCCSKAQIFQYTVWM